MNGDNIQIVESGLTVLADYEASKVAPDGMGVGGASHIAWLAPPHFYTSGWIIVLYLGAHRAVMQPLIFVLCASFAGTECSGTWSSIGGCKSRGPFFTGTGPVLAIHGEQMEGYEYLVPVAADLNADCVSSACSTFLIIGSVVPVERVAPLHCYKRGRAITLYIGVHTAMTYLLTSLLGAQFAGGRSEPLSLSASSSGGNDDSVVGYTEHDSDQGMGQKSAIGRVKADHMNDEQPDKARRHQRADTEDQGGIRAVHLQASGLGRMLGPLEADILDTVWLTTTQEVATAATAAATGDETAAPAWTTIGAVSRQLGPATNYRTVQTVMNRLVDKGLLLRREQARAYEYRAVLSRDALVARVTRDVVQGLVQDFGAVAMAQLVETIHEMSPEHRALLEHLAAGGAGESSPPDSAQAGSEQEHRGAEKRQNG